MRRTRTALIVGNGIAGSAAAMAMQKAGIAPVVYEARPASADAVGVFLTLASNGINALRVLDADKGALAAGFPTPLITLRSSNGKHLGETPAGCLPGHGAVSHTIKRADLYRALRDEATRRGVRVEHGKRLVAAEDTGDGVRAAFADGTEAAGDVLIGCDGVHSAARQTIDPAAPAPAYAGLLNTGGYADGVAVGIEPGRYEMIFGKQAFFGYAVAPDGQVWWFANLPRRDEPRAGELDDNGEQWRLQLVETFSEDAGPAVALIQATPNIMTPGPIHTIPNLRRWHSRRMIVIGDACHAPSPSSGQGASLSIEDAVVLAKCLRDLPDAQAAFAEFERIRRPRVERIIKWAARINSSKTAGRVGTVFRDAMLPAILRMTAGSKANTETYDYRIDWGTAEADIV